jgi:hypothetical protein
MSGGGYASLRWLGVVSGAAGRLGGFYFLSFLKMHVTTNKVFTV